MMYDLKRVLLWLLLLAPFPLWAASFSADALQSAPQGEQLYGKLYVSHDKLRFEVGERNQMMIQISNPELGKNWMVQSSTQTYWESAGVQLQTGQQNRLDIEAICQRQQMQCKVLSEEMIEGRQVQKWQVVNVTPQGEGAALIWVDRRASLPLRQQLADGTITTLSQKGEETINGRRTEKWQYISTDPQGQQTVVSQWYDPEIEMAVREEYPGGFVRELRNITLGEQDSVLFLPPNGYRLVEPPANPPQ